MNLSRSNDLKPLLVYKDPKESVPFSKIVVPSSMRSPLWKYFGFPADANKEIITKSQIICGICRARIAYNKNTTNLSTHLNCKHPDVLEQIKLSKKMKSVPKPFQTPIKLKQSQSSPPAKRHKEQTDEDINWYADSDSEIQTKPEPMPGHSSGLTVVRQMKTKRAIYKPKFQMTDEFVVLESSEVENIAIEHESDNQFIETIDYANKDYMDDDQSEIITEVLETQQRRSKDEFISEDFLTINEHNEVLYKLDEETPKQIVIASKPPPKIANKISMKRKVGQDLTEEMKQVKSFLIRDLIPPNIIDGAGFRELISYFSQNADLPNSSEVDSSIEKDYNLKHSEAMSAVKSTVHKRNYSLLLHKLGNSSMVEISMNSWMSGGWTGSLDNQIFCISKDCANFIVNFADSLANCSAFIVDFDLDLEGTVAQDIPVIPTFSFVTKKAFEACMELSAVKTAIKFDKNLLNKINSSFTWLQQFDHLSQSLNATTNAQNTQIIQLLVECLQPLKNCLDVLAFEASTYASIMLPIASQLIDQHYGDIDFDSETNAAEADESDIAVLEKDLKRTINHVLKQNIIDNPFLTMASFLDPRFQRLLKKDANDLQSIKDELEKCVENNEAQKSDEKSNDRFAKTKSERGAGLSSLFSNISSLTTMSKTPKNRFHIEFDSYTKDVSLDMELCPLDWWAENDALYPNIKQHVKKYFCVPAFVNNLHRLSLHDQEELERKYDRFANDIGEKLLWLHLDDLKQKLLDS